MATIMNSRQTITKNKWIGFGAVLALGVIFIGSKWIVNTPDPVVEIVDHSTQGESDQLGPTPNPHAAALVDQTANKLAETSSKPLPTYPNTTPETLENPFSPTLEDTDVDGKIVVGEDGKIVMNMEVRDFFDYFLSAVGEVEAELALDELLRTINRSLPPENAEEATAALVNYLSYKEDAVALMAQPMLPKGQQTPEYQLQVMESTLRELRDLRRQHMPEHQVEAFFGLEEDYEDYTLAAVRIQFNDTLSAGEKAQLIEYERSQLPEIIRRTEVRVAEDNMKHEAIQDSMNAENETLLVSTLDDHGYSEEEKSQVLEYKQQQTAFDERYQAYVAEKKSSLVDVINPEEQAQILNRLQNEFFMNETEITQAKVRDLNS